MKGSCSVRRIPHITLGVSDIKRAVSFYQKISGFQKIGEWLTYAIFDVAGVELGLEPKAKTEICLLVDDVDKSYQDLKAEGVKFVTEPKDQHWGGRTAKFVDPDGNIFTLESFQCRVCGKACQSYNELLEEHLKKHK